MLDKIIADVRQFKQVKIELDETGRERLLQAALGLTLGEAENVFAKIIVKDERLSGEDVNEVFAEKQQIIRKSGLLEYYATDENFTNVGGLSVLKEWLAKRAVAFTHGSAGVRPAVSQRDSDARRAGLRQKPVRQGGLEPVAIAAAAIRHGPDVRQPRRFVGRKCPPRNRGGGIGRAGDFVGG